MIRKTLSISLLAIAALLSACSLSLSTPAPTAAPTATTPPAATSPSQQTSSPTSLDPCVLLPVQEASSLAGTSFGPGEEQTTSGGGSLCIYGYQTTNVFMVEVAQAADQATMQAEMSQFQSDLEAKMPELTGAGITVVELPNFADGAATGQGSFNLNGVTISGSDFGFIKGTIFFGFSDLVLGTTAPSSAALQAEATIVLGRLP